ncbi:MAG TPA: phosphate ABC transporter permease subunit PstC, partial [Butyricimonas virosa]|nr:phosphate ABC transporter permease subunit PstC [Butyricimonas virosa]
MRDLIFKRLLSICCILILLISAGMIYSLVSGSIPALGHYGFFQFIGSTEWDPHPDRETYGALSFIVGTLLTSFLALIFCIPFSLPVALFTGEFFRGKKIATFISSI